MEDFFVFVVIKIGALNYEKFFLINSDSEASCICGLAYVDTIGADSPVCFIRIPDTRLGAFRVDVNVDVRIVCGYIFYLVPGRALLYRGVST